MMPQAILRSALMDDLEALEAEANSTEMVKPQHGSLYHPARADRREREKK
jgi:hypothetical protein